jgi:hypothetical protein
MRRYKVRTMRAAAGMYLTAAAVTAASVLGAGAAVAAPAAALAPLRAMERAAAPASASAPLRKREITTPASHRIAGIRQEMDQAVAWGEVTREQADRFVAQLESRILDAG